MPRPPFVLHWKDVVSDDDSRYPGSDELHSIGSPLGRATGLTRIGVHHELLPPSRRTSFPHAERDSEELVFVLEGAPDAWIDGDVYRLSPGDCVGFPAGTGIAHTFLNDTPEDVRLLVIGEHVEGAAVSYPLNPDLEASYGEKLWRDPPRRPMGPHDGRPRALRDGAAHAERGRVPALETDRLLLREPVVDDAELRFAMRSDPEHRRFLLVGDTASLEDQRAWMRWMRSDMVLGRSRAWTLVRKDSGEAIGQAGLVRIDAENRRASIAYEIARSAWGAGYAREAVARIVRFGFEVTGLHRIQAEIDPDNVRSRRLVEALDFSFEGILRGNSFFEGTFHDDAIYARVAAP